MQRSDVRVGRERKALPGNARGWSADGRKNDNCGMFIPFEQLLDESRDDGRRLERNNERRLLPRCAARHNGDGVTLHADRAGKTRRRVEGSSRRDSSVGRCPLCRSNLLFESGRALCDAYVTGTVDVESRVQDH